MAGQFAEQVLVLLRDFQAWDCKVAGLGKAMVIVLYLHMWGFGMWYNYHRYKLVFDWGRRCSDWYFVTEVTVLVLDIGDWEGIGLVWV